ncbi:hypothetical protein Back2_08040 [Nocardioides baekrokdamisoli]|uniref:Glycosyl transferase n=1 Tax=Nocardioides baekrokdamisoli TaxID=1804624 RepID=A0A3G9IC83_9ACTN|nr:glycosyltransferase family 2 protein [Nocardioides baekrokdamisoli]BBH16517.1 hypothetical protein Back2_08040 [Nocardioides baekrokdamisoli]
MAYPDETPASGVALVLISHDGAGWLPTVIDGIAAQTYPLVGVRAVDTGSKDQSAELLAAAYGDVQVLGRGTTFPEAVRAAVDGLDVEWVWILHDDSTPAPSALAALMAAAHKTGAGVLGPKIREWPSLRRLLEVGITISGTGRRETGLERAEYDHGQHDALRKVLAVNTAGMLVRREVLEQVGGFDDHLPIFGNDIDFCWRAAAAGHDTYVVPDAVVFHVAAAHNGVRQTPLTGRHIHFQERRAALFTLLANSNALALPWRMVRLVVGTMLRVLGFITVRQVGTALDELAALVHTYTHLGDLRAARKSRRRTRTRRTGLLAPWWLPYRHGLDFVTDVYAAVTTTAADVAERRQIAKAEADPASFAARERAIRDAEDADVPSESGWLVRFLGNPVAVALSVVVLLGLVAARAGFGHVAGGGLWAAPSGASDWWRTYLQSVHPVGLGTHVPAPPYLIPLAVLATLLGGSASLAISLLMIASFPVSLWGAWRLLRVVGRLISHRGAPRWLILWAATAYALLPYVSGAWGGGRLAFVVIAAILPWLAHAALGFSEPTHERRWVAGWRCGLMLTLVVAFSPAAWFAVVVLGLVATSAGYLLVRGPLKGVRIDRDVYGPPLLTAFIPVGLLAPWWLSAVWHGAAGGLLLEAGTVPASSINGWHLLAGTLPGAGLGWGLGLMFVVLAVIALVPVRTRIPVLACWALAACSTLAGAILSVIPVQLPSGTTHASLALVLLTLHGSLLVAISLGAQGAVAEGLDARRWLTGVLVVAGVVPVIVGLGWSALRAGDGLGTAPNAGVPDTLMDVGRAQPLGVLVLRGSTTNGIAYTIVRPGGVTEGQQALLALTPERSDVTQLVRELITRPTAQTMPALAADGIGYVAQPPGSDPAVTTVLDAAYGLQRTSTGNPAFRAWANCVIVAPTCAKTPVMALSPSGSISWMRVVLLMVQGLALFGVVVMSLPREWGATRV